MPCSLCLIILFNFQYDPVNWFCYVHFTNGENHTQKKANSELTVLSVGFQSPQSFSSIIIQIKFQDTSLKLYTESSEQSLCWLNEG